MQKEQQKYLTERLSALESNERNKLYKRASLIRKQHQSRGRPGEDEVVRRTKSLEDFVLQILLQEEADTPATPALESSSEQGVVIWMGPTSCRVSSTEGEIECALSKSQTIAVGDRVLFGKRGDGYSVGTVLPRTSKLSRPDPDNGYLERVIAANVELAVVVVSVVAPPLHPRIIDRYMIAIHRGGAKMLLAVNKCDLLNEFNEAEELSKLDPYKGAVTEILCSSKRGDGLDELRETIAGQTCVFVGHSGVGKSSLINKLHPCLNLPTGAVSQGYGRGTHTTTASTLHRLENGTQVIDTPGIRSFGLWDINKSELPWYFPEFDEFSLECKFRDCSHTHEPQCGVKLAVSRGNISNARYQIYLRILTTI